MGAPTVWMETADLLEKPEFEQMLIELGRFALLPRKQQLEECNGLIGEREYTYPFMFTGLGAYAAERICSGNCKGVVLGAETISKDNKAEGHLVAQRTWRALLSSLISENNIDGFMTTETIDAGNKHKLTEIPWISTNFTAQWCLNVIIALEFIRGDLPDNFLKAQELVENLEESAFHKA